VDKKIAETVLNRAGNYCEKCGKVGSDFALHHRKLKSRGGKDSVANLMAVHHGCHNLDTDSIHANPAQATKMGWMVPSWADPEDYPIHLPDGFIVRFDDQGTFKRIE
jgi:hypothetical protein